MWLVRNGTKVTGPFTLDDLRVLRQRKQFSPIHQVSTTGGDRWESAAQLIEMIDGQQQQTWKPPPGAHGPTTGTHDSGNSSPGTARANWYYLDSTRKQLGPVPEEALRELLASRKLSRRTMTCREGDANWEAAQARPEFAGAMPPQSSGPLLAFGGIFVVVVAGFLAFLIMHSTEPSESTSDPQPTNNAAAMTQAAANAPSTNSPTSVQSGAPSHSAASPQAESKSKVAPPSLIASPSDEVRIQQAVGLVVVCDRVTMPNGAVVEATTRPLLIEGYAFGVGSCFSVTPDGYFLTNRHVVDTCSALKKDVRLIDKETAEQLGISGVPVAHKIKSETGDTKTLQLVGFEVTVERPAIVYLNSVRFETEIIHVSTRFDLAILKINKMPVTPLPVFALSKKDKFERGISVTSLGYPGIATTQATPESRAQITRFMESTKAAIRGRKKSFVDAAMSNDYYAYSAHTGTIARMASFDGASVIHHRATIFHGNSGGPLVDSSATVFGINTWVPAEKETVESVFITAVVSQYRDEIDRFVPNICWK